MAFFKQILELIFPEKCIGCRKKHETLCTTCIEKIEKPQDNLPARYVALFSFKNPVLKRALWELKYKNKRLVANRVGKILGEHILGEISEVTIFSAQYTPILIPIPLHHTRKKKRGYNQSELIAESALSICGKNMGELRSDILFKIRDTEPQAKIKNRMKRLQNLAGCFAVKNPNTISGRNIILIDDVTTTGATLDEARKELIKNGAKKVIGYTIGH